MNNFLLKRLGAIVIDNMAILALPLGLLINMNISNNNALMIAGLIFLIYSLITPILFNGYNLGKYMLGIKIVKDDYGRPNIFQILLRELIKMMYTIPILGIILMLISNFIANKREDNKMLHDLISKTKVIVI